MTGGGGGARKGGSEDGVIWQDKEVRFDVAAASLNPGGGEVVYETMAPVEDHKGNHGAPGRLTFTNLRVTWYLAKTNRVNLSIGLGCIVSVSTTKTKSYLLKGEGSSIVVMTRFNNNRFEFVFTTEGERTKVALQTLGDLVKAYQGSRLYREVKLRGVIFAEDQKLKLLSEEEVHSKTNGVWNLSGETGNLGTFVITNVRVIWYANLAPTFNVSIPFIQIKNIRIKNSKFGTALVLDVYKQGGGFVLGFRLDPKEKLKQLYNELGSLWTAYSSRPNLGVVLERETQPEQIRLPMLEGDDDVEILQSIDNQDAFVAYYAEDYKGNNRKPEYNSALGLAMEPLKEGYTIDQLWDI
ncbi:Bardet-Biedl syndrome 5 protein [Chloropicon primus]|uniref:Bardet-Biedl syndrome 5 protein n=1 Tax=Chloropicon primus TaxID=1764295 RepID=A0A5B8MFK8_9CHLO|nr:Bardet-Biedl syndrome 5 protein [Chloropicon primus]UPQ98192.1 Bardet-Biedl syndrome 5 protein [Chloropicon primus]|eukprot:QDZ18984.1 Bardet-Biedl syndrome 5 protein [Chloropicon primus]